MEEKKPKMVHLSTFLIVLILFLVITILMGLCIYKLNNDLKNETTHSNELQNQVNSLNETISSINETENDTSDTDNTISFSDDQVRTAFADYLDLSLHAGFDSILPALTERGKLNYDSSKDISHNNGIYTTNVKFSDYKNAMLDYVSETEFARN